MLKLRAISFPLLMGLLFAVFFAPVAVGVWVFSFCAVVMIGLATYECARMVNDGLAPCFPKTAGFLSAAVMATILVSESMIFLGYADFLFGHRILTVCLMLVTAWMPWVVTVFGGPEAAKKGFTTVGVLLATVLPFSLVAKEYFPEPKYLLFVILVTKAMDTGGYVFGMLSGKLLPGGNHKLCPSISPKKSWEGFFGGVFLALLTAWALRAIFPTWDFSEQLGPYAMWKLLVFAVLLALASIAGDLTESALKRKCGVKDSGNLIPGMGGPLDVLDSFIYVGPVCLIYSGILTKFNL